MNQLRNLAVNLMRFATHENLERLHGNSIIWRYMSLAKFLDLLVNSCLFFADVRCLTDKNEAFIPEKTLAVKKGELMRKGYGGQELTNELDQFRQRYDPMQLQPLINCWSRNQHESYALWKIYLSGSTDGVAIRTTFSKLRQSIIRMNGDSDLTICYGIVQYEDYLKETELSKCRLIITKRKPYEYEREVRLFILNASQSTKHTNSLKCSRINVDVEHLVQQIFISPFADDWLFECLKAILNKYKPTLTERLKKSSIHDW